MQTVHLVLQSPIHIMKTLRTLLVSLAALAVSTALAQNASLSSDTPVLAQSGGTLVLRATADYEGEPGALGWSIALPADWSLVAINGPHVPSIAPEAGSTGTLEFAFTSVPAARADFSVIVRYPANAPTTQATSTALVRANGKLSTLTPAPVQMRGLDLGGVQRSRN
jgi:hypothetical protein